MYARLSPLVVVLALGLAPLAGAADGVIQINQARALAGGVTPGDTPGFPVTLSVPGTYILTSNLIPPDQNTNVIEVTSSLVHIDLNQFGILGGTLCAPDPTYGWPAGACANTGSGNGIFVAGAIPAINGLRVRNGVIAGMGNRGIDATNGVSMVFERVAVANAGGDGIASGPGVVARTVAIFLNGGAGFLGTGSNLIEDSTISQSRGSGISITGTATVRSTITNANFVNGLSISPAAAVLENCSSAGNGQIGMTISSDSVVREAWVAGNGIDPANVAPLPVAGILALNQVSIYSAVVTSNAGGGIQVGINSLVIGANVSNHPVSTGLTLGAGSGYRESVLNGNSTNVSGGVSMGDNVCGGTAGCP